MVDNFFMELAKSPLNSYRKTLTQLTLIADNCYSEYSFSAPRKNFKPNLTCYSFSWENKNNCYSNFKRAHLTHFSTFTLSELSNFSKASLSQVVALESP